MLSAPKIGVLALQGDFDAHRRRLEELGTEVVLIKKMCIRDSGCPNAPSGIASKLSCTVSPEGLTHVREWLSRIVTVSYTHLDVYKRQLCDQT